MKVKRTISIFVCIYLLGMSMGCFAHCPHAVIIAEKLKQYNFAKLIPQEGIVYKVAYMHEENKCPLVYNILTDKIPVAYHTEYSYSMGEKGTKGSMVGNPRPPTFCQLSDECCIFVDDISKKEDRNCVYNISRIDTSPSGQEYLTLGAVAHDQEEFTGDPNIDISLANEK